MDEIEEYIEGDACAICWGVGKTFGDIPTPERVEMTGSGFAGAFAVCNGTFIAVQLAANACRYEFHIGTVNGVLIFGAVNTYFEMSVDGVGLAYAKNEGLCVLTSTDAGKTIAVERDKPQTPEWKVAFEQNFSPDEASVYDDLGAANGDGVLRLANQADNILIYVRYEPEY